MKTKKLIVPMLFCFLILICILPNVVFADNRTILDISKSSIIIADGIAFGKDPDGVDVTVPNPEGYIIIGSSTTNNITVAGGTHNITLYDVDIDVSTSPISALNITSGSTVNLTLKGDNNLTGGSDNITVFCAGMQVPNGAIVNITGQEDGTGSLVANGSLTAAGIGGGSANVNAGTININGGTITANGGSGDGFLLDVGGAGIGGGISGNGGNITINGGNVSANGGSGAFGSGAGIGGGSNGNLGNVTITGGTVNAFGGGVGLGGGGAGIGSGAFGSVAAGDSVNVSGGTVMATGGDSSAGIGGGCSTSGVDVVITGGNIKATGSNNAADIGGDVGKSNGSLTNGTDVVELIIITLDGALANAPISNLDSGTYNYDMTDTKTIDTNKVYAYLPTFTEVNGIKTPDNTMYVNPTTMPIIAGLIPSATFKSLSANIGNVTVSGLKDETITSQQAVITLNHGIFKSIAANTDVSSWFTNLPVGLVAKVETSVSDGSTSLTVTFSGIPTVTSDDTMTIKIPGAKIGISSNFDVTSNTNAKWDIVIPTVTSVSVDPATASVNKGSAKTFSATVTGTNNPPLSVTWTVEGGVAGTSIDSTGKLTIAADETATTLTVKAISTYDNTKVGTAIVTVTASVVSGSGGSSGTISNPVTYDNISTYIVMEMVSLIVLIGFGLSIKKRIN